MKKGWKGRHEVGSEMDRSLGVGDREPGLSEGAKHVEKGEK